ncbi:fimbrial protein [Paraburkholderia sp. C35]|uniref:fimbrial protein n=1 Tax=Paraburkholderia sp. C35 TaxID=2126993 RepID=UPI000D687A8F|nr:fimbrial protein [Paraburkholderia sp. C35]
MKLTRLCKNEHSWLMRLVQMVFVGLVLLAASRAHASGISCSAFPTVGFVPNVGTNPFPRDAPIGSATQYYKSDFGFNCQRDPCCDRNVYPAFITDPDYRPVSGYSDVYRTNLRGVGVRYLIENGSGTSCQGLPHSISNQSLSPRCHQMAGPYSPGVDYRFNISVQFIKYDEIESGNLTSIPFVQVDVTANNQAGSMVHSRPIPGRAAGSFYIGACTVRQSTIDISMPAASVKDLTAVGATTGDTPFTLSLDCDPGVRVAMTLRDATTSNQGCDLTLTKDSTAKGVRYQIMYDGKAVCYGPDSAAAGTTNQFFVSSTPTAGGLLAVPFTVRYVRTGAVNGGSAKALSTFTMSYE